MIDALAPAGTRAALIGSDWGGGIALSMAHSRKHRHRVRSVVTHLPSYSEVEKGELSKIKSDVMV